MFYIFLLFTLPVLLSQNSCDNCLTGLNSGQNIDCTVPCEHHTTHLTDCLQYTRCLYDYNLHKVRNICICEKPECEYEYLCPHVEKLQDKNKNIQGYTTYEVSIELKNLNSNVYAIYGNEDNNMIVPAAYQLPNHQGSNLGGINPLLAHYVPDTTYDSWLTIQLTDGNPIGIVDAIGIDFNSWDENNPLIIDKGAIFLDDPMEQLSNNKKYIIGHLTLRNNEDHQMIINVNGRINFNDINSDSYSEQNIIINFSEVYGISEH